MLSRQHAAWLTARRAVNFSGCCRTDLRPPCIQFPDVPQLVSRPPNKTFQTDHTVEIFSACHDRTKKKINVQRQPRDIMTKSTRHKRYARRARQVGNQNNHQINCQMGPLNAPECRAIIVCRVESQGRWPTVSNPSVRWWVTSRCPWQTHVALFCQELLGLSLPHSFPCLLLLLCEVEGFVQGRRGLCRAAGLM